MELDVRILDASSRPASERRVGRARVVRGRQLSVCFTQASTWVGFAGRSATILQRLIATPVARAVTHASGQLGQLHGLPDEAASLKVIGGP